MFGKAPLLLSAGFKQLLFVGLCLGCQAGKAQESALTYSQQWVTSTGTDDVSGQPVVAASRRFDFGASGIVNVRALCRRDSTTEAASISSAMDAMMAAIASSTNATWHKQDVDDRVLEFRMRYLPGNSGLSLVLSPIAKTATVNPTTGVTIVSPPDYCAAIDLTVDDTRKPRFPSATCNEPNIASLAFTATSLSSSIGKVMPASPSGNDFTAGITAFLGNILDVADPSAAPMQAVLGSGEMKIGLPLSDGNSASVDIEPRGAAFQEFVAKCVATFPNPPVAEQVEPGGPLGIDVRTATTLRSPQNYDPKNVIQVLTVLQAYRDGPASLAGMQMGDVILSVDYQPVHSAADIVRVIAAKDPNHAQVQVSRNGNLYGYNLTPNPISPADLKAANAAPANAQPSQPSTTTANALTPGITYWSSQPTTAKGVVLIQYEADSKPGETLIGTELWRAKDRDGKPGTWEKVQAQDLTSGLGRTPVVFSDRPQPGKYWYGARVYDSEGNVATEPAPQLITVTH